MRYFILLYGTHPSRSSFQSDNFRIRNGWGIGEGLDPNLVLDELLDFVQVETGFPSYLV